MRKKRYEMLLPLKDNAGQPVSEELFKQTREELLAEFGSLSFQPIPVHGIWTYEGKRYEDELLRFVVDVSDTARNRRFFTRFKKTLLRRFEQIEIYLVSYPIEVH